MEASRGQGHVLWLPATCLCSARSAAAALCPCCVPPSLFHVTLPSSCDPTHARSGPSHVPFAVCSVFPPHSCRLARCLHQALLTCRLLGEAFPEHPWEMAPLPPSVSRRCRFPPGTSRYPECDVLICSIVPLLGRRPLVQAGTSVCFSHSSPVVPMPLGARQTRVDPLIFGGSW